MPAGKHRHLNSRSTLIIAALLLMIGAGLFFLHRWEQRQLELEAAAAVDTRRTDGDSRLTVWYNDSWYALRDGLDFYLLMGLDKFENTRSDADGYNNNQQADFLLLLALDESGRTCTVLHINRDTMAEIQVLGMGGVKVGRFNGQICLAHSFGTGGKDSCRNTVQAVSAFLYGLPIQHFVSVTMDAVPVLNDLAGGVTVYVEDDLTAVDPSLVQGKEITLNGRQALSFVRARMTVADGTNLNRMKRQRSYIAALSEKLFANIHKSDSFALEAALSISDYLVSDCTALQLAELGKTLSELEFTEIYTPEGKAVRNGDYIEFYADEAALQALVIQLYFQPLE